MTPPGNGTGAGGPVDGDHPAAPDGPGRRAGRALLIVVGVVVLVVVVVGVVAVRLAPDRGTPNLLDAEAPALSDFTFHSVRGCRFEADRGGLVASVDLRTRATGRFTIDLEAVPARGVGNLDVVTTHAVRVTVPFYAGQTRKRFDVVVPLTRADYEQGYRKCRYTLNPSGAD